LASTQGVNLAASHAGESNLFEQVGDPLSFEGRRKRGGKVEEKIAAATGK
jgi:hypothetical protein